MGLEMPPGGTCSVSLVQLLPRCLGRQQMHLALEGKVPGIPMWEMGACPQHKLGPHHNSDWTLPG